jgi:hypothetical protein
LILLRVSENSGGKVDLKKFTSTLWESCNNKGKSKEIAFVTYCKIKS